MATYLLSWDPTRWDWRNIKEQAESVTRGTPVVRQWACGTARRIFSGDIVYFIRQGREPRGLFARAEVVRGSYEASNADVQDAQRGRNTLVIDVQFRELVNAHQMVLVQKADLKGGLFGKFVWDIKESGIKLPEDIATELTSLWHRNLVDAGLANPSAPTNAVSAKAPPTASTKQKKETTVPMDEAPAPAIKAVPPIPAKAVSSNEREKLKAEREARLEKIKSRDRGQAVAATPAAPPEPEPVSEEERNEILIENYFVMLDAELQGELYSKADHRSRIMKEANISNEKLVDKLHQDISAVMAEAGLPFVDAYPPQETPERNIENAVHAFIEDNPELVDAMWLDKAQAQTIPVELDDYKSAWVKTPEVTKFKPRALDRWHPARVMDMDFRLREFRDMNLAAAGERFVMAFERARLRAAGLKDRIEEIIWQSQTYGESFGYDIRSLNDDGSERYIAVKATNYGPQFPFMILDHELAQAASDPLNFHLYRVFQFSRKPKLFILNGKELITRHKEPAMVRIWP